MSRPIDPLPLGGFVSGMDFRNLPHGTLEIATDEAFRSALGKNARVLLVPDEKEYRAAPALANALEAVFACLQCGEDFGQCSACRKRMGDALRLAGRLP